MKTIITLLTLALLGTVVDFAGAQELNLSANRKITGQYYLPHTARTYSKHAINHAEVLQYYGKNNATVPTETAKEHAVVPPERDDERALELF